MSKSQVAVAVVVADVAVVEKIQYYVVRQDLGGKPGLELMKKRELSVVEAAIVANSWKINSSFEKSTATQNHKVFLADVGFVVKTKVAAVAAVAEVAEEPVVAEVKKSKKSK